MVCARVGNSLIDEDVNSCDDLTIEGAIGAVFGSEGVVGIVRAKLASTTSNIRYSSD